MSRRVPQTAETAAPNGRLTDREALRPVARALGELRRGDPMLLHDERRDGLVVAAAETLGTAAWERLLTLSGGTVRLVLTARRGHALGLVPDAAANAGAAGLFALSAEDMAIAEVHALACPAPAPEAPAPPMHGVRSVAPGPLDADALDLVRRARLLPAAVIAPLALGSAVRASDWAAANDVLPVTRRQLAAHGAASGTVLDRTAAARVPLPGAEETQVVAFRPGDGGKPHLAIVVGTPDPAGPVLVRVHSECFTGDLLGSLRCDCGDQLRGAIAAMAAAGGGVLLYLSQEGRGIGLVNKLRAYELQDAGADTAEANERLGFDADERVYSPAAEMLRQLGIARVRLLTNNPEKVATLARHGVTVEERVPHSFPANSHNDFYLATKAARFGHDL